MDNAASAVIARPGLPTPGPGPLAVLARDPRHGQWLALSRPDRPTVRPPDDPARTPPLPAGKIPWIRFQPQHLSPICHRETDLRPPLEPLQTLLGKQLSCLILLPLSIIGFFPCAMPHRTHVGLPHVGNPDTRGRCPSSLPLSALEVPVCSFFQHHDEKHNGATKVSDRRREPQTDTGRSSTWASRNPLNASRSSRDISMNRSPTTNRGAAAETRSYHMVSPTALMARPVGSSHWR